MMRLTTSIAVLASTFLSAAALAAPAATPVTACGQVLPANARAVLTADLDCTGQPVGVVLGRGARLSLGGFTLGNAFNGVQCDGSCRVTGPGTISGNQAGVLSNKTVKVRGVTISGQAVYGIQADVVELEASTITGVAFFAVQGQRSARIENSSISASFGGVSGGRATLKHSTIAASQFGISGTSAALKKGSAVDVSGPPDASAIRVINRPTLSSGSTCTGRSVGLGSHAPASWGVCSLD